MPSPPEKPPEPGGPVDPHASSGRPDRRRALVVENDPDVAGTLERTLRRLGLDVDVAPTAAAARSRLAGGPPDLILLDLGLPDADGRVLLAEVRALPGFAGTPVIVLTGRHSEMIRRECLALGADGFVEKPFELDALLEKVTETLERGRAEGPAAAGPSPELVERYRHYCELAGHGVTAGMAVLAMEPGAPLETLAAAVQDTARQADEVVRLPDGRLVLLLPYTGPEGARRVVDRVRGRLAEAWSPKRDHEGAPPVVSAGMTDIRPGTHVEGALEEARRSLHLTPSGPAARSARSTRSTRSTRSANVLLVEGDAVTATLIGDRLQRAGHRVTRVSDGAAGVEQLDREPPDLVLLDLELPGMGGFEVLRHIRTSDGSRNAPVVVLTTLGQDEDATRAFAMGASDYMVKPLSPSELLARVERLLSGSV